MRTPRTTLATFAVCLGGVALAPTSGAMPSDAAHHDQGRASRHVHAAQRPPITFTNPLGRSRGVGAGGGLL